MHDAGNYEADSASGTATFKDCKHERMQSAVPHSFEVWFMVFWVWRTTLQQD
jgi:hypothetical protein